MRGGCGFGSRKICKYRPRDMQQGLIPDTKEACQGLSELTIQVEKY